MRVLQSALVLISVFMLGTFAHALSDDNYQRLMEHYRDFARAEKHLGHAWNQIKELVHAQKFAHYQADQRHWSQEGRDMAVEQAMSEYHREAGEIPSNYVHNGHFGKDQAYTMVTLERAKQLNILLTQTRQQDFTLELAGNFYKKAGHYWFRPYLWWTPFKVCSEDALDDLGHATRNAIHRAVKNPDKRVICQANLALPAVFDLEREIRVKDLPEGMAWRELDHWDDFGE
ncbi:hypothetical protein LJC46_07015 [Desulfovibrio sp. OttesenSCG-928-G15]|nr:hypothetical protein [Desulfovibrio sp. OttesenSCG-928-G15]